MILKLTSLNFEIFFFFHKLDIILSACFQSYWKIRLIGDNEDLYCSNISSAASPIWHKTVGDINKYFARRDQEGTI